MERGPLALFGAILAVGLGPAMWLGVQFGQAVDTGRPPAAVQQQSDNRGGVGAAAPEDQVDIIRTNPKSNVEPLSTVAPRPRRSVGTPSRSPSATPSETPDDPSSEPAQHETTPPTAPASQPGGADPSADPDPSHDDGKNPVTPPSPPADQPSEGASAA